MAIRTRANKMAHILERSGLAMAGASGGLYVGAHALNAGLFASAAILFAMIVLGAVGFYLGIDLPPKEERMNAAGVAEAFSSEVETGSREENASNQKPRAGLRFDQKRTRSSPAGTDWAEWLSSIGTFLAAAVAFLAVFRIVEGADPLTMSALVIAVVWLIGVGMQIVAGAIARHER
jgi:hypothetical protein